ncbi:MAG: hypothetical protein CVT89_00465 [Candidatus Altiarchaeales archaeon HGW-Altiarchaeales-2]|nr:MAG: hypothetical protein CVT89_00465 [Candidatus Altiarchaeales archaeon HGW-Altiarchaeales-2]
MLKLKQMTEIKKNGQKMDANLTQIRPKSAQNPPQIRHKTDTNLTQIRHKMDANLTQNGHKSDTNPQQIHIKSATNNRVDLIYNNLISFSRIQKILKFLLSL